MTPFFAFLQREKATLWSGIQRFPAATIIWALSVALLFYITNRWNGWNSFSSDYLVFLTGIVAFFFALGVTLFLEKKTFPRYLTFLLPVIYAVAFFLALDRFSEGESALYFFLHLVGVLGLLFSLPYIELVFSKKETPEYFNSLLSLSGVFARATLISIILCILGYIAIISITELFNIDDITRRLSLYQNWAIVTFAVVAPLYGMYQIQVGQIEKKQYKIPRLFSLLVRYIAVPALVVYFAILYAYSIQVLTHFSDWPKGMISYLVIGFTLFGYATYIFTRPYEEGMTGTFRKYFPYAVIPQAGMLLYAIYLRIAQYGLTPNRYIVVLFGLLLLGLSLYYIFSQSKKLIFIPLSFAVTAFLFSIGPWSVKFFPLVYNHYIPHTGIMEGKNREPVQSEYLNFYLQNDMKRQPVSLIGYDQMVTIFPEAPPSSDIVYPYISYNGATQIVTYHLSDTETIPYTLSVRESLLQNKESNSLESPELTFLLVGAKYDILLMFENLAIKNPRYTGKTGEGYMPRPRGIALVKEKR